MNGQFDFRGLLLKIQELLSENDRHRLHFLLGEDVPRYLRDDLSLSGTLRLLDSLFEKAFISDQDCDYLIQAFNKIQCHDAMRRLQEYQQTRKQDNQRSFSLQDILLHDDEEDKIRSTRIMANIFDPILTSNSSSSLTDILLQSNSAISLPSMHKKTEKNIHTFRQMNMIFKTPLNIREYILLIIIIILALLASLLVIKLWSKHVQWNTTIITTGTTTTTATTTTTTTTTATTAITTTGTTTTTTNRRIFSSWKQNGLTVAGGNGRGNQSNQFYHPHGIYVDDDHQCIYIADQSNNRIVEWKYDAKMGQVVAGGNGEGNRIDQLYEPRDVIVDKMTDSLIICDWLNSRVVRWPRQNGKNGETIISNIACGGLTMDNNRDLYVSDVQMSEVRKWKIGEKTNGIIVAGGNGKGKNLNQLYIPRYLFVDKDYSVYVSDHGNNRVMKWIKGAKEGIVVAGGQDKGNNLTQLDNPDGLIVDDLGNVYVADCGNHRIMCWSKGSKEGRIIVGGNGAGTQANQLFYPIGLSFDRKGNLYVVDYWNDRVQKFEIDLN